jgi:hypothetical protein
MPNAIPPRLAASLRVAADTLPRGRRGRPDRARSAASAGMACSAAVRTVACQAHPTMEA